MKHCPVIATALLSLTLLIMPATLAADESHVHDHPHHEHHGHHDAAAGHPGAPTEMATTPPAGSHDHGAHDGHGDDDVAELHAGRMIYEMSCVFCHGTRGRGDGGAAIFLGPYSHPRPNDFTTATFKFRSTPSGELPLLADLMRTIRKGIPGYMPAYRNLGERGIRQVARYIEAEFIGRPLPTTTPLRFLDYPGPAAYTPDSIRRGRGLYETFGCAACHGDDGSHTALHMSDQRGLMVMPMDLTRPEMFGNGHRPEDLYRTLMTGLDGTPMPGYAVAFAGREHEVWDLVHYLMSLETP